MLYACDLSGTPAPAVTSDPTGASGLTADPSATPDAAAAPDAEARAEAVREIVRGRFRKPPR